jgi:hypothetical protein
MGASLWILMSYRFDVRLAQGAMPVVITTSRRSSGFPETVRKNLCLSKIRLEWWSFPVLLSPRIDHRFQFRFGHTGDLVHHDPHTMLDFDFAISLLGIKPVESF